MYRQSAEKKFGKRTLSNFTWKVYSVTYDWENNKAIVEILINTEFLEVSELDCTEEWTSSKVLEEILKLPAFKGSVVI